MRQSAEKSKHGLRRRKEPVARLSRCVGLFCQLRRHLRVFYLFASANRASGIVTPFWVSHVHAALPLAHWTNSQRISSNLGGKIGFGGGTSMTSAKRALAMSLLAATALAPAGSALAGGFGNRLQSAVGTGSAFAGAGTEAYGLSGM